MTDENTFNDYINTTLQLTKGNSLPVGGVSIIALGDFIQLSPVMGRASIQPPKSIGCNCLGGNLSVQLFEFMCLVV